MGVGVDQAGEADLPAEVDDFGARLGADARPIASIFSPDTRTVTFFCAASLLPS